jgi:hypothetical protein
MNKLPREKLNRILLIGAGTAAVLALVWFALVQNQLVTVRKKQAEIKTAVARNEEAKSLLNRAEELKSNLEISTRNLNEIEGTLVSGGIPWVYKTIPKFSEAGDRKVTLVDVQSAARYGEVGLVPNFPYQAVTFTIALSALYADFGRFVADFENQFPYFRIQNLEIGRSKGGLATDNEKLDFRLDIVALVKPGSLP